MKKIVFGIFIFLSAFILVACKDETYEVSFDLNYETSLVAPKSQSLKEGEKATEPNPPTRDGYQFEGWFKKDASKAYDFSTIVDSKFTLYAHWKLITEDEKIDFYLAGSFSNYNAKDEDYALVKCEDGIYTITVELTDENRDVTYDGHYYKVTDGTWDTCYGVDNYYIDPAPLSPTGGGLGSIWHWGNGVLTVSFDAEELLITDELEMSEDYIREVGPAIYGKFNNWSLSEVDGFHLTDEDNDGIFTGTIEFSDEGTSDFSVCLSEKYYNDEWGQRWGAEEQYKLDGSPAGMGDASEITYEAGVYFFTYNSETKITTYQKVEADVIREFSYPRLYGKFNAWELESSSAFFLTDEDNDGIFTGTIEFSDEGTSDFSVCLSQKFYDDQWGQRWGAEEQYKLDGSPAGMGDASEITYEAGVYFFTYNSETKITTYQKVEADVIREFLYPRLYGKFNAWALESSSAFFLTDEDNDGIFTGTIEFSDEVTTDITLCLSQKFYDDEWGKRWGAEEQYKLDGSPAGMGNSSEIIYEAGVYFFTYNSETKITTYQKVEADVIREFLYPRLYGKFNSWALESSSAFFLTDEDNDGIFTGTIEFTDEGTTDITLCLSQKFYDDEWGKRWGAEEQYKLDGSPAGMGNSSEIIYEAGVYFFTYNSETKITTYQKVEADVIREFLYPRLYGKFNSWALESSSAFFLTDEDNDGIFTGTIEFTDEGTTDITLCLSQKFYDDEWGKRWGAEEQYKLDGSPAGMGDASEITYEAGVYLFTYNSETKITTYEKQI